MPTHIVVVVHGGSQPDASHRLEHCKHSHGSRGWLFCPHKDQQKKQEANMTVHVMLLIGKKDSGISGMLGESLGKGILDSACTKTVAGMNWLNEYVAILPEQVKTKCKGVHEEKPISV